MIKSYYSCNCYKEMVDWSAGVGFGESVGRKFCCYFEAESLASWYLFVNSAKSIFANTPDLYPNTAIFQTNIVHYCNVKLALFLTISVDRSSMRFISVSLFYR